jgi:hypothetical protein
LSERTQQKCSSATAYSASPLCESTARESEGGQLISESVGRESEREKSGVTHLRRADPS